MSEIGHLDFSLEIPTTLDLCDKVTALLSVIGEEEDMHGTTSLVAEDSFADESEVPRVVLDRFGARPQEYTRYEYRIIMLGLGAHLTIDFSRSYRDMRDGVLEDRQDDVLYELHPDNLCYLATVFDEDYDGAEDPIDSEITEVDRLQLDWFLDLLTKQVTPPI